MAHYNKKRKSKKKKQDEDKLTRATTLNTKLQPNPFGQERLTRSNTLNPESRNPWTQQDSPQPNHTSPSLPPLKPLKRGLNKSDRAKSFGLKQSEEVDSDFEDFNLNTLNSKKKGNRRKSAASFEVSQKDFKIKWERANNKTHELNRTITDQQYTINNLKHELRKYTKLDHDHIMTTDKHYQRTIKHKEKEIANLRRRLKLAINDYEKVYGYYQKQLDLFKKNQQKWLNEQKANNRDVTKFVFADDVRRIKPRKKGVRIYFGDGEDVIFDNIEVLRGKDYNDDDDYRNIIKKARQAAPVSQEEKKRDIVIEVLDEDDMIILCLNELTARLRDFKHKHEGEVYARKIAERYKKLPIYHVDDDYLRLLKTNNNSWLKLFTAARNGNGHGNVGNGTKMKVVVNGKRKGKFGGFFSAQKEMKLGKQPTICVQNNVILNNINSHSKDPRVPYSTHLQERIDIAVLENGEFKMAAESQNDGKDEDLKGLQDVSVFNGWFTAQIEMNQYNKQPSVCIKNGINLNKIQKAKRFKFKNKKIRAKNIQQRLDGSIKRVRHGNKHSKHNGYGHGKYVAVDRGDSSEEDEKGNSTYRAAKIAQSYTPKITAFSDIMNGWLSSQIDIADSKQPTICVQNNVILNNINNTKDMVEYKGKGNKWNKKKAKKKRKKKIITARQLQKKLNETTSNGLSQNALDLSDDEDDGKDDNKYDDNDNKVHENMWYYKDKQRTKFVKSIQINAEKCKLLLQIGAYLNRILPTSLDYDMIAHYMPVFNNVYDIICACMDGVLLSVLINFIDDTLIDLRAIHLPTNKYPISDEEIVENMWVVKLCINSLDLHEFPDFAISFDAASDDRDYFAWFNREKHLDILLLIVMHQFMGMMNAKINVFRYPELFRLCQHKIEKKTAQKCSCKEWLHRWIIFMKKPKMKNDDGTFASIDLGSYHSPVNSGGNISWDSIKIPPQNEESKAEITEYVWDIDGNYANDINTIQKALNIKINNISTIVLLKDIKNNNYLLQLLYLSDLFVFNNKINKLSATESKSVYNYLHKLPSSDTSIIAWVNSLKIVGDGNYIDNLDADISDGIIFLHILDSCLPGCVDWKNNGIRSREEIRHKFDKLTNCNMVVDILSNNKVLRDIFRLVGVGGNDIVDGNAKYIRSLLLQIQRYHSTKLMAKILFKKKQVTDDELLQWMNNRLKVYKKMVNAMDKMHHNDLTNHFSIRVKMKKNVNIANFEDKLALSDQISFCNLVSSINPKWINYKCIHNETECQQKNNGNKKLENAKYLITIMRRLGCDKIFISPKELAQCEGRAVLTISTSIMTIAARYNEYDQLALFAKNLKQIKAKMQKK